MIGYQKTIDFSLFLDASVPPFRGQILDSTREDKKTQKKSQKQTLPQNHYIPPCRAHRER